MLKVFTLMLLGFQMFYSSGPAPQSNPEPELNLSLIRERIAKTLPEGLQVIEQAKAQRPIIQKYPSAKALGEIVEDCASGRGLFFIRPIGWEAVRSDSARWSISFYFQDEEQRFWQATWGFNTDKNTLYPLELNHATRFWVKGKMMYP
jgi:hypothetical protein